MTNPINILYALLLVIVVAVGGYFYGHHVAAAECKVTLLAMEQKANAEYAKKVNEFTEASTQLEKLRNERKTTTTVINRRVEVLAQRPVTACLDADSLRTANEALSGRTSNTNSTP